MTGLQKAAEFNKRLKALLKESASEREVNCVREMAVIALEDDDEARS